MSTELIKVIELDTAEDSKNTLEVTSTILEEDQNPLG